jgi:hypothetical protein
VRPEPPNTTGQLHNVLLKAYFDDKRKFSHLRPHASAQISLDDAVSGIQKLNVDRDRTQQMSDSQSDSNTENSGKEDSEPATSNTNRNIDQIIMGDKSNLSETNTENKQ